MDNEHYLKLSINCFRNIFADLNYLIDALDGPNSVYENATEGTGSTDLPSPLFTELSMSEETGIEEEASADVEQTSTYSHPQRGKYVSAFFFFTRLSDATRKF